MTLNEVRKAVEEELGFKDGFFKSEPWRSKSKSVIQDEMNKPQDISSLSETKPKQTPIRKKPDSKAKIGLKRKLEEGNTLPKKKHKRTKSSDSDSDVASSGSDSGQDYRLDTSKAKGTSTTNGSRKPKKKQIASDDESGLSPMHSPSRPTNAEVAIADPSPAPKKNEDDSGSELSEVLDEPPKRRKGGKTDRKPKKDSKAKKPPKTPISDDPNDAEMKRLQGWLVKCGIRKLWGKELKPYETPKAKINHLKEMLSDAGMTGRYSAEKAAQIKEARELAAEMEDVKEGDKIWGKDSEDEDDGRPTKRLVKKSQKLDFVSSGEES